MPIRIRENLSLGIFGGGSGGGVAPTHIVGAAFFLRPGAVKHRAFVLRGGVDISVGAETGR